MSLPQNVLFPYRHPLLWDEPIKIVCDWWFTFVHQHKLKWRELVWVNVCHLCTVYGDSLKRHADMHSKVIGELQGSRSTDQQELNDLRAGSTATFHSANDNIQVSFDEPDTAFRSHRNVNRNVYLNKFENRSLWRWIMQCENSWTKWTTTLFSQTRCIMEVHSCSRFWIMALSQIA